MLFIKQCLFYFVIFVLAGCGINFQPKNISAGNSLGGQALPIYEEISQGIFALSPCADAEIKLYEIETNGTINESSPIATTPIDQSANFSFGPEVVAQLKTNSNVGYLLKTSECNGESYMRPVTDFDSSQDIDYKTTLVAQVINTDTPRKLNESKREDVKNLFNKISGNDFQTSYNSLTTSANAEFLIIFGSNPNSLEVAKPDAFVNAPAITNELQAATFAAEAFHWSPTYSTAFSWKLDGQVVSNNSSWTFIPGKNDQGYHNIHLYVGANDGSNAIDTTQPYLIKTFQILVNNTSLPIAPDILLNGTSPTSNENISIDLNTGALLANCDSFDSFIITGESTAPSNTASYNLSCSTNGTQTENYSLTSSEGSKRVYIYAIDSAGVISSSKYIDITLDKSGPTLAFSSSISNKKGNASTAINFSATDSLTDITNISLYYTTDGSSYNLITGAITPGSTSYSWAVPAIDSASVKVKLTSTNELGLTSEVLSNTFTIDSIPPVAPSITLESNQYSQSTTIAMTPSSCTDTPYLLVNESTQPASSDANWVACSTTSSSLAYTVSSEGQHTLKIWAKDSVGNVSAAAQSVTVYLDSTAPTLSLSIIDDVIGGGAAKSVTATLTELHASSTQKIVFEIFNGTNWATLGETSVNDGPLSGNPYSLNYTAPAYNSSNAKIRATFTDLSGRTTTTTSNTFTIDSTAPLVTSISVNNGQTLTGNKNVLLSYSATDTLSKINAFCIKYNVSTMPNSNDSCWFLMTDIGETPVPSINIEDYTYTIGSIQSDYDVRVWLKDEAGNISTISNSGNGTQGTDLYRITLNPDPAPTITNVIASSTDTPSSPLNQTDTTIPFETDIYIRWNISDNNALPSGAITISFTDSTYTQTVSNLENGVNNGCTLQAGQTGCYRWSMGSPTSNFFQIKVEVTDSGGATIYELSNPINTGSVRFLSGNTSLGFGGMATNGILFGRDEAQFNDAADPQAFVVTKTGYIFYRYKERGIVYISPTDGILRDLIPQSGSITGDGGSVFSATSAYIGKLTLDKNDNLIFIDDGRVRKVDLSATPWTISTLFGGGGDPSDGAIGISADLGGSSDTLTATPDGKIYYNKNNEIWYYNPTDQKVHLYRTLTGIGTSNLATWEANYDNSTCLGRNAVFAYNKSNSNITKIFRHMSRTPEAECGSNTVANSPGYNTNFNLSTGVAEAPHPPDTLYSTWKFTGLDGNIYALTHGRSTLMKYNLASNSFEVILGVTGQVGRCDEDTPALSCNATIMSAFVNEYGKIYFLDLGVIKTVESGLVKTVAGQPRNFGIGYNPMSARYSKINFFEVVGNDVYIKNNLENQIVKFSLTGGNLSHIAGNTVRAAPINDSDAKTSPLASCEWSMPCSFIVDSANSRLYHMAAKNRVSYIDLTTSKWVVADTPAIRTQTGTRVSYVGLKSDGPLMYLTSNHGISGTNSGLRFLKASDLSTTRIYGSEVTTAAPDPDICTGVVGTTCALPSTQYDTIQMRLKYDTTDNSWIIGVKSKTGLYKIPALGGTPTPFLTASTTMAAFEYLDTAGTDYLYYCGTGGKLYKKNLTTNIASQLTLPITGMICSSNSLFYHTGRSSLIFAYELNGMAGIAEYVNP